MTATDAAARVWIAVGAASTGVLLASLGAAASLGVAAAASGAATVGLRRRPAIAKAGLFLLVMGLAVLRPVGSWSEVEAAPAGSSDRFRTSLRASLSDVDRREAALISGLTIGDTTDVDHATTETFRRAGLAHLVAVSGSNVAIVLAALAVVTFALPLLMRAGIGLVGLGLYVAVVGSDPSVLRAAAMGVVGVIAYVAGRPAAPLNSLGIALIAVLAAKPELLFAIGLHLSAAATFGIVVWARPLDRLLGRLPALVRAPVAITVAAQIAVAPLVVIAFERLSLVAPVANVIAAPAVPPATVLGLAAGVVGLVMPEVAGIVAAVAAPFARWILWIADTSGGWSWASIDAPAWAGWAMGVPIAIAGVASAVRAARG